jgi:hypothetical protein
MTSLLDSRASVFLDEAVSTDESTNGYYDRKVDGRCTYPGCPRHATDESVLCAKHLASQRERKRRSQNAIRAARRKAGLCPRCGETSTQDYMCSACRVIHARMRGPNSAGEHKQEHKPTKAQRIAERIIAWENSPTNAGRKRLRGGKRGRRSIETIDGEDLDDAKRCIDHGIEGLAYFRQLDKEAQMPKVQREDVKAQALAKLVECRRWLREVIERHGYLEPLEAEQIGDLDEDEDT